MKLHLFKYDTFRRHAQMCIEPAIVHKWRNWQDGMLQLLAQREKVIVAGDMRADSTGTLLDKFTLLKKKRFPILVLHILFLLYLTHPVQSSFLTR